MMHETLWHGFIGLVVLGAVCAVSARRPTLAGASVVVMLFCLSGICMMLDAHLLAVLVIAAYAGSLLVSLGLVERLLSSASRGAGRWLVYALGALGLLGVVAIYASQALRVSPRAAGHRYGLHTLEAIGAMLVTSSHFLPLLVTGGLLIVSALGGAALARRLADGSP